MGAVHICIGHNNYFIVAQFSYIKIVAVTFGKAAAKGINHCFNFRVGEDFINAGFFHI